MKVFSQNVMSLLSYNTIMQWLRLHTHSNLLSHQCGAHMRCLNNFICCGWAYGTISKWLPQHLMTQIMKVCQKLTSLLSYKQLHHAVVEAPHPFKPPFTSMWSPYEVFEPLHMLWMGIRNHQRMVTTAFDDPDYENWPKSYVTAELQTTPSCIT